MPYQQHVWDVALEVEADGSFAYDAIDLTIMRQSGKTTLEFAKSVWRLTVAPNLTKPDGRKWGRQRALYTAQRRADARKKLEQDFAMMLRDARESFTEVKDTRSKPAKPTEWKLSLNNGQEHILFGRGNYFQIDAPTADAGHSDSLDDANLDEIWALQNGAVEEGVAPTQATRWNAQMWKLSTAGDESSYYMWPIVKAGRAISCTCSAQYLDDCSCGYQPKSRTAYFEWSLPEDCDIDDEDLWWEHMPALGRTISIEYVRSQLEKARNKPDEGGEDLWRRGYGNMWVRTPLLGGETRLAKLPAQQWADASIDYDDIPIMNPGHVVLGFDVTPGGEWSSIVLGAGFASEPYVELLEHEQATGWLPRRLVELAAEWRPRAIGFDQAGPAGALADVIREALRQAGLDAGLVRPLPSGEYKAACGGFYLAVAEGRLRRWSDQPALDEAGNDATERRVGDAWVWDRRSATVPISPLVAATCARALLVADDEEEIEVTLW